jgi:hypothetical protein
MKYVVIPDTSAAANYTEANGTKVRVRAVADLAHVSGPATVVANLDGLRPIPYTAAQQQQFARAQAAKAAAIEQAYQAQLAGGITVGALTLAASESDQNSFSRLITLLATAEAALSGATAEAAFESSSQTIADQSGAAHTMTISALRSLIISYGQAIAALWTAKATRQAAAAAATTFEQLATV